MKFLRLSFLIGKPRRLNNVITQLSTGFKDLNILLVCMCVYIPDMLRGLWRPEKAIRCPGAGQQLDMGAGN